MNKGRTRRKRAPLLESPTPTETTEPTEPIFKNVIGFIEVVNESGIHGWAYDQNEPARPIALLFLIDGKRIEEVGCIKFRKDVFEAGHPRAEVGFHVRIPREYFDGNTHTYSFTDLSGNSVPLHSVEVAGSGVNTFSWTTYFDADFYRKYYSEVGSDLEAYQHWLGTANSSGRFPNHIKLVEHLGQTGIPLPDDFSPKIYQRLNKDIAEKINSEWEATLHYIERGKAEGRNYRIAGNRFIVDLYFGGVQPPSSELERFLFSPPELIYLSLEELLERNGITSQAFMRELNVSDYAADNPDANLRSLMQCVRHFAESGITECRPLSFDHGFDHTFVCEVDLQYADLSQADAYRLWINAGIDAGVAPNGAIFLRKLGLTDVSGFPADFDAEVHLARNPDLKGALRSRWAALQHFVQHGLAEGRHGSRISKRNCDLYRAAADRLAVAERLESAKKIYEVLLAEDPENTLGLRHYADCLLRLNDYFAAAQVYEKTVDFGKANIWTYLNLANCYMKLERWRNASDTLCRACAVYPGDRNLVRRHEEIMRQSHGELMKEVDWLAKNKFYSQARNRAREACALMATPILAMGPVPALARDGVRTLAIVADLGLPQCKFYRVEQKAEQVSAAGLQCRVFDYRSELEKFTQQIPSVDAVIFYRVPARPDVMRAVKMVRAAGLPAFFEIDDLMFDGDRFPDSFESYGGQITHDLYASLVTGSVFLSAAMAACDYAIGSTPTLAQAMESLVVSGRAFVHRNALSGPHEKSYRAARSSRNGGDRVRIFYGSGTKAHNDDFEIHLAGPLEQLLRKWGDKLEIVILGYLTLPAALKAYGSQISMHDPIWDLHTYWGLLREMDINIAVLKPGLVADCKSEIKWLEAAMLGVPSVVTATRTYQEVIEDKVTGILVKDPHDWFRSLDTLIADAARRRSIGSAARDVALQSYSLAAMAENIRQIMGRVTAAPRSGKKRVLIVNVFYPPQAIGGATRVVADNVRDVLAAHGEEFEFQVFCTLEGGAKAYVARTYYLDGVKVTAITAPVEPNIDMKAWDDRMADAFTGVVERFQPDIVHLHCIQRITVSICRVLREKTIPYVVTVHDGWWISDQQFLVDDYGIEQRYDFTDPLSEFRRGGRERFERMKLKQEYLLAAQRVLAVSKPFADIYRRSGFDNVSVIENGVSPLEFLPKRPSPDGRVRLAHIGGANAHKGYNLIRAALFRGDFKNLTMLVIDHAMDPAAERHAVWGKTPVTLRGKFPQSRIAELYSQIDVLLTPSVWPESYGLVAREAALAGCWVVASNRGAIGQDITPEMGFVVEAGSYHDLLSVFSQIDRDPAKYTSSPAAVPSLRLASQQAEEVVDLYRTLLLPENRFATQQVPTLSTNAGGIPRKTHKFG
jgi:glycosyltransferase involved in cell wall biosynthesis/tetratricopeptide (TPR) repeat protein